MTPEKKVKDFITRYMKTWFPEAFTYAPPGIGYFGRNGMPDRMWFIKANKYTCVPVVIEAKSDTGKLTELQLKTLTKLARQGVVAAVVVGKDIEHMRRIRDEINRRISLSNEGPREEALPKSDSNDAVHPTK
jgi:hypothetical protein